MTAEVATRLVEDLRTIRSRVRIKERDGAAYAWDWPLFSPTRNYLETAASGPLALSAVECIDVEKEEKKHRGSLVPPLVIDHAREIEAILAKHGLIFESEDGYIRIKA